MPLRRKQLEQGQQGRLRQESRALSLLSTNWMRLKRQAGNEFIERILARHPLFRPRITTGPL